MLRLVPHDKDMLTQLCLELESFTNEELGDLLIVLPTQRLGQYLLAILAKQRKAFVSPHLVTLETLIQQNSKKTSLTAVTEERLLASLLKQSRYRHLQKGHEHEIREFFSQIEQTNLGESVFQSLKNITQKDIYRDESHTGSLVERIHELSLLYNDYRRLLSQKNVMSSEQHARHCVQELLRDWESQEKLPWRWCFLACFTTIKPYCRPLFQFLLQRKNVTLLFSEAPQLLGKQSPLQELIECLTGKSSSSSTKEPLPLQREHTRILACNSLLAETQAALATVQKYIDQGCPESRIALLLTKESVYSKILISCLEQASFKCNLAIAQPFVQCTIGSWLLRCLQYFISLRSYDKNSETESLRRLCDLISHPWSWNSVQADLSEDDLEMIIYDLSKADAKRLPHPLVTLFLKKMDALASLVKGSKREPLRVWQNALLMMFAEFGLNRLDDGKKSEQEALQSFYEFLEQWALCWDEPVTSQECFFALLDCLQNLQTRSIGFPLEGVQVLDLIEARYVPFEVVIVLGCVEGYFPRALPNDRLVGDMLKVKLGMPGWQYIEALEDTTFHLLCRQAKHFTFLYSLNPDYGSLCRSRFIERILSQDKGFLSTYGTTRELCRQPLDFARSDAENSLAGDYSGDRKALFESISASSLTQVFRCPYQFLLSKLGVKEKKEESPSLWEGRWLHEILEAFYTGLLQKKEVCEPLPQRLTLAFEERIPFATKRLDMITDLCLPDFVKGSPFHLHVKHFAWPRFAEHWSQFFEQCEDGLWTFSPSHSLKEYPLVARGLPIDANEHSSITGTLDSFDVHRQVSVLVDYKRKHVDSVSDVAKGLSPQLPLYALALAQNRFQDDEEFLETCLIGYWSLSEGRWQARGVGDKARDWALKKKLVSSQTPPVHALVNTLHTLWDKTMSELLHENKNFRPLANEDCEYCPFTGICRIEEGTAL